tara:strand:- start:25700 stop:26005 length:306 start_codon:yes stop_codon:yes gene_type:complete
MKLIKKVEPKKIIDVITELSGFSSDDLSSQETSGSVADWRHIAMYVAKENGIPIKKIGEMFNRHFSTVSAAERKVKAMLDHEEITAVLDNIKDKLTSTQLE